MEILGLAITVEPLEGAFRAHVGKEAVFFTGIGLPLFEQLLKAKSEWLHPRLREAAQAATIKVKEPGLRQLAVYLSMSHLAMEIRHQGDVPLNLDSLQWKTADLGMTTTLPFVLEHLKKATAAQRILFLSHLLHLSEQDAAQTLESLRRYMDR
jgi:hypothetical protein